MQVPGIYQYIDIDLKKVSQLTSYIQMLATSFRKASQLGIPTEGIRQVPILKFRDFLDDLLIISQFIF